MRVGMSPNNSEKRLINARRLCRCSGFKCSINDSKDLKVSEFDNRACGNREWPVSPSSGTESGGSVSIIAELR